MVSSQKKAGSPGFALDLFLNQIFSAENWYEERLAHEQEYQRHPDRKIVSHPHSSCISYHSTSREPNLMSVMSFCGVIEA